MANSAVAERLPRSQGEWLDETIRRAHAFDADRTDAKLDAYLDALHKLDLPHLQELNRRRLRDG